jgi:hypothetical protein
VNIDRRTLDLAAPVLCTIGGLVAVLASLRSRPRNASGVLSALLGFVGSAAWAAAAYQDSLDATLVDASPS